MSGNSYAGPKLPRSLLDQVGGSSKTKRQGRHAGNASGSRKDRRKLERVSKKTAIYQKPRRSHVGIQRKQESNAQESENEDNDESDDGIAGQGQSSATQSLNMPSVKSISKTPEKTKTKAETVRNIPKERKTNKKLEEDDAEIAALEKKLGLKSKKKLPKAFGDDGLDLLLDGLEDSEDSDTGSKRKRGADDAWLEAKRRRTTAQTGDDRVGTQDSASDLDQYGAFSDSEDSGVEDEELEGEISAQGDSDAFGFDETDEDEGSDAPTEEKPTLPTRVRENPYVAPIEGAVPSANKYIPPSLRTSSSSDAELALRLRRQTQGVLNRLSEANLLTILGEVEKLYQTHPRQFVTSTIIDLLLGLVCDRSILQDTFMILHGGFIAALYRVIGADFGAQLIERIVLEFDKHYDLTNNKDGAENKESSNLISLLLQLYNFHVIGSTLIFDLVRQLLQHLSELNTELLLRVVKQSGSQLRQDDPSSLKDLVTMLQRTVASADEATLSVRTKFMIETINNLKNNKMKTGVAASAVTAEHSTRMKKTLGSLSNRPSVKATEPLRAGLADLRDTEKRGKWWLVGASWKGASTTQPQVRPEHNQKQAKSTSEAEAALSDDDNDTTDILRLAQEQRMNTDIRRAIFVTIMSASDYKDAHLRLLKLRLKRSQEREIPRVLMHCAGAEERYNPYYTLIAQKLCKDYKSRMAFKFALFDFLKRMGQGVDDDYEQLDDDEQQAVTIAQAVSLGKMFGNLVAAGALEITIFKNLDFVNLQPRARMFTEVLFLTLITAKRPFEDILRTALTDSTFMAGVQFFLKRVVAKTDLIADQVERSKVKRACKSAGFFISTSTINT